MGREQDAAVVVAYDFTGAGTVVDVGGGQKSDDTPCRVAGKKCAGMPAMPRR